jgi:hypothetical protein
LGAGFVTRARSGPSGLGGTPGGERLADQNARRGRRCREARSTCQGGKPLKGEPQERHRRETKPEGIREEQSVKGLRKPAGVAQPGEVSPVLVASRLFIRCRGGKPHERRASREAVRFGSYPGVERSPREDPGRIFAILPAWDTREDLVGRILRDVRPRGERQPIRRYRVLRKDSGGHVDCMRGRGRRGDTALSARAGPSTLRGNIGSRLSRTTHLARGQGSQLVCRDEDAEPTRVGWSRERLAYLPAH